MIVSARYSDPEHTRVISTDERGREWSHGVNSEVGDWVRYLANGGQISDYVAPPPPDLSAIDLAELNRALTEQGSVMRALAEVVFGIAKGTIPVTPSLTKPQFVALLKDRMRA